MAGAALGPVGIGLTGLSLFMQGAAESSAASYKGAQASRAAEIGRIQADQADTDYRTRLNTTISNIRAVRAATGGNPNSPSLDAFVAGEETANERQRRIKVGGIRSQADQYDNDALFYRNSANSALFGGAVKSLAYFATPREE